MPLAKIISLKGKDKDYYVMTFDKTLFYSMIFRPAVIGGAVAGSVGIIASIVCCIYLVRKAKKGKKRTRNRSQEVDNTGEVLTWREKATSKLTEFFNQYEAEEDPVDVYESRPTEFSLDALKPSGESTSKESIIGANPMHKNPISRNEIKSTSTEETSSITERDIV